MENRVQTVASEEPIALLLWITGLTGFCVGLLHPAWQIAVEGAQVIAGVVTYPGETHLYNYYLDIHTILHQICAFFLRAGVSERSLCFFLSGLSGMISFQALALCVFTFSRNFLLATAFPFVILFLSPYGHWSQNYGIVLLGSQATYGVFALVVPLLAIGLFGVGWHKPAALLLGLSPAVHPASGVPFSLAALICLWWSSKDLLQRQGIVKAMLLGYGISSFSLVYHFLVIHPEPAIVFKNLFSRSEYVSTFVRYWDPHRQPIVLLSLPTFLFLSSLVVSVLGLTTLRATLPKDALFALRILLTSGIFAGLFSAIHFLPPETVPNIFLAFMPTRMLNLNALALPVLLIGISDFFRRYVLFELTLSGLLAALYLFPKQSVYPLLLASLAFSVAACFHRALPSTRIVRMASATLCLICGFYLALSPSVDPVLFGIYSVEKFVLILVFLSLAMLALWSKFKRPLEPLRILLVGLMILGIGIHVSLHWDEDRAALRDRTNDPFFLEISRGRGLLLTGSDVAFIQLCTRRPVLLDGSMVESVSYTPRSWPMVDRVLKEIYGVDIFHPSTDVIRRHPGGLERDTRKALWEERTPEEWSKIKQSFGVVDVLTYADWNLKLPRQATDGELTLYQIP